MVAYEAHITITDPSKIILVDLPFRAGQQVKVIIEIEDEGRAERLRQWKQLFKEIQALPQVQGITEEDIAKEIAAYRAEK
jgi:hypothetical protein